MKKKILSIFVITLVIVLVLPTINAIDISENRKYIEDMKNTCNADFVLNTWSIVATYPIPEGASGLAFDGNYLYCGIYGSNGDQVYEINPSTGSYQLKFNGPQEDSFGLTYDGIYLWTTDHPGSSSTPAVAMKMDMSGDLLDQFDLPDHYMSGIAYDDGSFWVATYYPDPATIYKVNGTGSVIKSFTAPDNQPWDLCRQSGYLWMADYWGDTLYKIDPSDGTLIDSHSSEGVDPAGIVWDGQYLWYCDNGVDYNDDYLYKVDLSGGGTPELDVPITEHDYGLVTVGDTSYWNNTLYNIGTADLIISGVTISGSSDVSCPLSFPIIITPGNNTLIQLEYNPSGFGELNAIATIESNDPVTPNVDITLSGHGVNPGPDIGVIEKVHDYGLVRINAYTRWDIVVQNLGDETISIYDAMGNNSLFIVDDTLSYPFNIDVLSEAHIGVWFQPDGAIEFEGTITIESNDPVDPYYDIFVSGTGLDTTYPIGDLLWSDQITTDYDNSIKAIAPINDINGDGKSDVIICSEDDYIRCFNGNAHDHGDIIWEHKIYAGSVYQQQDLQIIQDINNDSYYDVIVGSCWGGRLIRAISGKTGDEIWTHYTDEYGDGGWVYQVECSFDYNGDGVIDVLASTGDDAGDTGPKRVYCLNALDGNSIWECYLGGPGFSVKGVEDFTEDGIPDAVAGASDEGETQGFVYGINGDTGSIEWTYPVIGSSVWALEQIDDITGDGVKDVIAGDFDISSNGFIYAINAKTGALVDSDSGYGAIVGFEKMEDVNGDGHPDIIPEHSDPNVIAIDGYNITKLWNYGVADKVWSVAISEDLSGDGINDVMVGTLYTNNYCYFLDGVNGSEMESVYIGTPIDAISAIPDIVGDGSWEMIAGDRDGYIYCYSGGLGVPPVVCGDADGSGFVDIDDVVYLIAYIFSGGPEPVPMYCAGDADGSGGVDIDDVVYLISYIFSGGPEPDPNCCG